MCHISENTTVECRACSFVFVLWDYLYSYGKQLSQNSQELAVVWDYKPNHDYLIFAGAGTCMFSATEVNGGAGS